MKVKMTSILVDNPIEAFKFYTEKIGFKELMYMPDMQLAIVVAPDDPDGVAVMLEPNGMEFSQNFQKEAYERGMPVIVFGSNDIQADYERLKNNGVVFKQEPKKTDWGHIAVFDDTCGNYIQIHQDL